MFYAMHFVAFLLFLCFFFFCILPSLFLSLGCVVVDWKSSDFCVNCIGQRHRCRPYISSSLGRFYSVLSALAWSVSAVLGAVVNCPVLHHAETVTVVLDRVVAEYKIEKIL